MEVKIGRRYQVVIPRAIRTQLGLHEGDRLFVEIRADGLLLWRPPKSFTESSQGMAKAMWESCGGSEAYLDEQERAWRS